MRNCISCSETGWSNRFSLIYMFLKCCIHISVLKDVPWEKFLISLFHDENGNWELDMNEQGIPVEGYAREKCKKEADASATVKMKMYYPVND